MKLSTPTNSATKQTIKSLAMRQRNARELVAANLNGGTSYGMTLALRELRRADSAMSLHIKNLRRAQ